ncbi:hypothetical protein Ccrd_021300, partial [Cynara cardunculus var. scolymus]
MYKSQCPQTRSKISEHVFAAWNRVPHVLCDAYDHEEKHMIMKKSGEANLGWDELTGRHSSLSFINAAESALLGKMAILMPQIIQAKQILRRSLSNGSSNTCIAIPKVYAGEQEAKRFM